MTTRDKPPRPKAALPRGFRDAAGDEVRATRRMIERVSAVYESYGFEPLATPALEFTEALGKFLPDQDRPNEGVFSLKDEDEQWMSLRYDLTAPLARYVAENYDGLPKPFRRYQSGPVWRNEKPGPGRFREFMQIDADTVGTANPAADAEMCMLAADALEAIGIGRGDYVIRVSSRMLMDGILERLDLGGAAEGAGARMAVMRAVDKLDRLGPDGVRLLLGAGRKDESGDFTRGAGLAERDIDIVMGFTETGGASRGDVLERLAKLCGGTASGDAGLSVLADIDRLLAACGYEAGRVAFDPTVVRGLEYYTGPVLEAELTFEAADDAGRPVRFGSVGGGGRYDGLVARFRGEAVPATGFSVGLSRLNAALEHLGRNAAERVAPPVVILAMDRDAQAGYQAMARELRAAGVRAEVYMGTSGMKPQMKYADRRGAPLVVIEGTQERAEGVVTLKDLIEGARLAAGIDDRATWTEARPAQETVARGRLVETVVDWLARHGYGPGVRR